MFLNKDISVAKDLYNITCFQPTALINKLSNEIVGINRKVQYSVSTYYSLLLEVYLQLVMVDSPFRIFVPISEAAKRWRGTRDPSRLVCSVNIIFYCDQLFFYQRFSPSL